jgi:hypothetical protein
LKYPAQAIAYGLFMLLVGLFSAWPQFDLRNEGDGKLSLALSHAGKLLGECRRLTPEELQALPPNMRNPVDCPRGRHDIFVSLQIDGQEVYAKVLPPTGIWGDGEASVYHRLPIAGGEHSLFVGLADSGREDGFDYEYVTQFFIRDGDHVVIEFDSMSQGFVLKGGVDAID